MIAGKYGRTLQNIVNGEKMNLCEKKVTFGTQLRDWPMATRGLKNEILSLCICIVNGFCLGLVWQQCVDVKSVYNWPTEQMESRGLWRSLAEGGNMFFYFFYFFVFDERVCLFIKCENKEN